MSDQRVARIIRRNHYKGTQSFTLFCVLNVMTRLIKKILY